MIQEFNAIIKMVYPPNECTPDERSPYIEVTFPAPAGTTVADLAELAFHEAEWVCDMHASDVYLDNAKLITITRSDPTWYTYHSGRTTEGYDYQERVLLRDPQGYADYVNYYSTHPDTTPRPTDATSFGPPVPDYETPF